MNLKSGVADGSFRDVSEDAEIFRETFVFPCGKLSARALPGKNTVVLLWIDGGGAWGKNVKIQKARTAAP